MKIIKLLYSIIILFGFIACSDYMDALKSDNSNPTEIEGGICNESKTLCISEIKVAEKTFSSFSISWKVTATAATYIIYRKGDESKETDSQFATEESVLQTVKDLEDDTKYYYKIVAKTNTDTIETLEVSVSTDKKPADTSSPVCGNGTCDTGEDVTSCIVDCAVDSNCGNGTCDTGEDSTTCSIA